MWLLLRFKSDTTPRNTGSITGDASSHVVPNICWLIFCWCGQHVRYSNLKGESTHINFRFLWLWGWTGKNWRKWYRQHWIRSSQVLLVGAKFRKCAAESFCELAAAAWWHPILLNPALVNSLCTNEQIIHEENHFLNDWWCWSLWEQGGPPDHFQNETFGTDF